MVKQLKNAIENIERSKIDIFLGRILEWHKENNRNYLFWRKTRNPYYILVAEMMLQKTTVKQVQNLIEKFLAKFPTPKELMEASTEEIEQMITSLGLEHNRALRYKTWAKVVEERYAGKVPESETELLSLPGVGQYIANSVLCLAFGKDTPIVDTNVIRVLERVFDIKSDKKRPRTDKRVWDFVRNITPKGHSRDLNLALLDFGALICTARNPKHANCPVNNICTAYREGRI